MKKVLFFFGGILLVLFLMIFRPVQIPSDEKDLNSISGTVEYIFEGGTKDATFRLTEYQGKMFYINRGCLLYTSPSPRDRTRSRMPSSA